MVFQGGQDGDFITPEGFWGWMRWVFNNTEGCVVLGGMRWRFYNTEGCGDLRWTRWTCDDTEGHEFWRWRW